MWNSNNGKEIQEKNSYRVFEEKIQSNGFEAT